LRRSYLGSVIRALFKASDRHGKVPQRAHSAPFKPKETAMAEQPIIPYLTVKDASGAIAFYQTEI